MALQLWCFDPTICHHFIMKLEHLLVLVKKVRALATYSRVKTIHVIGIQNFMVFRNFTGLRRLNWWDCFEIILHSGEMKTKLLG